MLDLPDSGTKSTLESSATNAKTTGNGQYAIALTPWILNPGVPAGVIRTVPPSASVAGVISRVDGSDNPNTPAAGVLGELRYAIGLSQGAFSDNDRQELNSYGIAVVRSVYGTFWNYGYRSLADPINNPNWVDFSNVRYLMWLASRCDLAGEQFVFRPIDGQLHTISDYGAVLSAICQADYNAGIIYGAVASDAFNVDVGPSVNTPSTIADNQLRAVVAVRPSPFGELVTITIVNVPITQPVS